MRGINHVIIGGNLGRDPEVRSNSNGKKVVSFSVALSKKYKKENGDLEETLQWVRVVCFSELAEICEKTLSKGDEVVVDGALLLSEWTDRDGKRVKSTEVLAKEVSFVSVRRWREKARVDGAQEIF